MGNPYEIIPLGGLDLGGGIAALGDRYRQSRDVKEQKQAQQAQAQQMQAEKLRQQEVLGAASKYYQEGNTDGLAELMIQNPALADQMQKSVNFVSDVSRKDSAQTALKSLMQLHAGGSVNALAAGRAERVINEGGDPSDTIAAAKITDPAEQIREYEMQLMVSDSSLWEMYKEQTAKPEGDIYEQGTGAMSGSPFNKTKGLYGESQRSSASGPSAFPRSMTSSLTDEGNKSRVEEVYNAAGGGKDGVAAATKERDMLEIKEKRIKSLSGIDEKLQTMYPDASTGELNQLSESVKLAKDVPTGIKASRAVREKQKADKKGLQFKDKAIHLLKKIKGSDQIGDVTGAIEGSYDFRASQSETDLIADIKEASNILLADNLKMMSGVLSESDIKILRDVAAGGLDRKRSKKEFISNVDRILKALQNGSASTNPEDQLMGDIGGLNAGSFKTSGGVQFKVK
jgi:hypothetical protein